MNDKTFKDLFSVQASDYSKYRPNYPAELFLYLQSLNGEKKYAWDCGTGNGQAAVELAKIFDHVIATDPSEKQLEAAVKKENIQYSVATAENFYTDKKINLTTVAQAFHWFKHEQFAEVLKKVSAPDAHLAVWSYAIAHITPEVDAAVDSLYNGILSGYWEKERAHVEDGYKNIHMPFKEIETPQIDMKIDWELDQLVGYLSTWSALQKYIKTNQHNPLNDVYEKIKKAWGDQKVRTVSWPLTLKVWKI